ncbi:MAG TPA: tetratricopeptide repeat protein [Bryobacteraceae bacterium]|jgi:tetratricopeptide (TPR) repeat protein|nr:tetratricopeptide repeat protein [Bryobacteraceae bacterium]
MKSLVVFLAAFVLVSCNRDPNVAKKHYLENGNKYFAKGKYKEASIMYRNALQKDQRYGPAYYRLAQTDLRLGRVPNALGELRRAIELIPKDQPDHREAEVRLAEIYLAFTRESQFLSEVETVTKELLQQDPNSYDGHRLTGDLDFVRAQTTLSAGNPEQAKKLVASAVAEYRKAISVKPPDTAIRMQLARALAADRQFPEAEQIYKQLVNQDKALVQAYNELYGIYLVQHQIADAEQILKTGAAANPKQVSFLVSLASFYSALHRHDEMVATLNQIKGHVKDYDRAYLVVGDFYFRSGDLGEAYKQYTEGIAKDPKQKPTYQKRMIEVLMRQNRRMEAADINTAILKENPKDSDARGLQASFLLDRGDLQKAISELQAVVNAAPDNFVARYNLGRAHVARGEWEQARQQFTAAFHERPDYLPARLALAQLQVMRSDFDAALKSVGEILQIDRRNGPARMIEAASLLGEKKYDDARRLLLAIRQANPTAPDIDFSLGMVSLKEGKLKESEDIFRKAYAANPKDARGLVGLVETLSAEGHFDQAIQFLQSELAKSPTRNDLQMTLGNVALRAGNFDLAIAQFQTVLNELDKNSRVRGEVYFRLGITMRKKGDVNGAILALYKAREALPENSLVVNELALALDTAGRKPEAETAYDQAVKLDPQNAYALNNLAFLIADSGGGDLDQALTYAQRAKQVMPNLPEVSDTLGWIYLKKNMSDSAMDIFQELVEKMPQNATYRYHLGMAYAQKGDKVKALRELQQALRIGPGKDEVNHIRDLINKLQA